MSWTVYALWDDTRNDYYEKSADGVPFTYTRLSTAKAKITSLSKRWRYVNGSIKLSIKELNLSTE